MFCLKMLSIIPMLSATSDLLPINPPTQLTPSTGLNSLYGICESYFPNKGQYEYPCDNLIYELERYQDSLFDLLKKELCSKDIKLVHDVTTLFFTVYNDLELQFANQLPVLEYIFGKTTVLPENIDSNIGFIARNLALSPSEFASKYSEFLYNGILEKYSEELKKLDSIDFRSHFKAEIELNKYVVINNEFESLFDVMIFVNRRVLLFINVLSSQPSIEE